jgi:hypothetical protein
MKNIYRNVLLKIKEAEENLSLTPETVVADSRKMVILLNEQLQTLKDYVLKNGFDSHQEEIQFFRDIKPQICGKLLYYNKLFRIETARPAELGSVSRKYFKEKLTKAESNYIETQTVSEFYRYYRSGRSDKDEKYFLRGNIDWEQGLSSRVFEIDIHFSTYYDYEIARIISRDMLYEYLYFRSEAFRGADASITPSSGSKKIPWTESQNALIELIYALHISRSVGYGKTGIRQLALLFQSIFDVKFGDIHHAFHRMKYRNGPTYLDRLKASLESYISENL